MYIRSFSKSKVLRRSSGDVLLERGNVLLELVHSFSHVVDAADNLVGHRLEAVLCLLQNALNLKLGIE